MASSDESTFAKESRAAAEKRVSRSNMQGYDQIIAISEDAINSALKTRFNHELAGKKNTRLRQFHHAIPQWGEIEATLDRPRLQMVVPTDDQKVIFFLNFSKGSFNYWSGHGPFSKQHAQPIDGWSIAFRTSFKFSVLAEVPAAIRDRISMKQENYSVSQLLLGFSAGATATLDWEKSICPGREETQELKLAQTTYFDEYMKQYMKYMSTGPYSVLGYAIKVVDTQEERRRKMEDPNVKPEDKPVAPSFPPTSVTCRTQAYEPCSPEFQDHISRSSLDHFLFLEMTEGRNFPKVPYEPKLAGNWVVGGLQASLCLSKHIFWDRFLVEKFRSLNEQSLILANDLYYWVHPKKNAKAQNNPWVIDTNPKPTVPSWTLTETGAAFDWTGIWNKRPTEWWNKGAFRDDLKTDVKSTMKWLSGKDSVEVAVEITSFKEDWTRGQGGEHSMGDTMTQTTATIEWKLKMVLNTIQNGKLEIRIIHEQPVLNCKISSTQEVWDWGGRYKEYENESKRIMEKSLDIDAIRQELTNALNGSSRFVFPGAGDFEMKDPKFNPSGDLIIGLKYISQGIVIDDDFYLQVDAPGTTFHGQYVQVITANDDSATTTVADISSATSFTLDDGDLVVDLKEGKLGQRASTKANGGNLQDLKFSSQATLKTRGGRKMEFSTTGSSFSYSVDGTNWLNYFILDEQNQLRMMVGPDSHSKPFGLLAIY